MHMKKYGLALLVALALTATMPVAIGAQVCAQQELINLTLTEAADRIRAGELSSEQLVSELLQRAEMGNYLNAYITLDGEGALQAARQADERTGDKEQTGPLHGVPFVVKDNIEVAGLPNTAGTPALSDNIAAANAPVVQALVAAGAVVLGKTNMHELALGITSDNAAFGAVRNPYNPLLFAGGSSGGTAAAIAARMAPAGLGTDTGGSMRIPAALTGIVGFRPTKGRYPADDVTPISPTRDTPGPMARSVADIVLLDGIITDSATTREAADLSSLRLGVPQTYFHDNLDPHVEARMKQVREALAEAGVEFVEADLEDIAELNSKVAFPVVLHEVIRALPEYLQRTDLDLTAVIEQIASPDVRAIMQEAVGPDGQAGTDDDAISGEDYRQAIDEFRPALQKLYADYFEEHDVDAIIFPTTPLPARPIEGSLESVLLNGEQVPTFPTYIRNMDPDSNAGIPGLTLPVGLTPAGLPIGLEIDGPAGSDGRLLSIGLALEELLPDTPAPVLSAAENADCR